jgi:hypothetical protein
MLRLGHTHIWFWSTRDIIVQAFRGDDSRLRLLMGIMENGKGVDFVPPRLVKESGRYMDHLPAVADHCPKPDFPGVIYFGNFNTTADIHETKA